MHALEEFLLAFMKEAAATSWEEEIPVYQPVPNMGDERLFDYEECFNKGKRYGFILKENRVVSIGEHFNSTLEGIERFYGKACIEDGIFKEDYFKGIGIKYYRQGNKYSIGKHNDRSTLEKGFGYPTGDLLNQEGVPTAVHLLLLQHLHAGHQLPPSRTHKQHHHGEQTQEERLQVHRGVQAQIA
jgi:hypothetical protein